MLVLLGQMLVGLCQLDLQLTINVFVFSIDFDKLIDLFDGFLVASLESVWGDGRVGHRNEAPLHHI